MQRKFRALYCNHYTRISAIDQNAEDAADSLTQITISQRGFFIGTCMSMLKG